MESARPRYWPSSQAQALHCGGAGSIVNQSLSFSSSLQTFSLALTQRAINIWKNLRRIDSMLGLLDYNVERNRARGICSYGLKIGTPKKLNACMKSG